MLSKLDGDDYIVTLPQLTVISANTNLIITITLPNDIQDFFFDPWGHKVEEEGVVIAVVFNQLVNQIEITIRTTNDMHINTNNIIGSIWSINETV